MRTAILMLTVVGLLLGGVFAQTYIDFPVADSGDAIMNSELVWFYDAPNDTVRAQTASDVRTFMQAGITVDVTGKLDTDLQNVASLTTTEQEAFRTAIGAGTPQPIDLSGKLNTTLDNLGTVTGPDKLDFRTELDVMKTDMANIDTSTTPLSNAATIRAALGIDSAVVGKLDRDLQNVDQSLSNIEKNAFRAFVDIMDVRGANLVTGLSLAERDAIRGKITAAVAPVVFPDENVSANVSLLQDQVIHFTNTGNTYIAVADVTNIQINLIRNDTTNFRQIHLPHVTAAEITAGTEVRARAMGPADVVSIINAHKPTIDYPDLAGEPFIYVAPGDALPTPTSANQTFLVVAGAAQGRIIYHQKVEHGSDLSVTYRLFNSSDLASGNFIGAVNYPENRPTDANDGDVIFVRSDHNIYIWNDTAQQWAYLPWGGGEFLGTFISKAAADQAVAAHYPSGQEANAINKHLAYGSSLSTRQIYTITAFTPDTADVRTWQPVFGDAATDLTAIADYDASAIQFVINDESVIAWHGIPSVLNELGLEPASIRNIVAPMFTHQSEYAYDMGTGRITTTFPSGGMGTTVTANPGGDSNTDLTSIGIGGTNYDIPAGQGEDNVQANWTEINTLSDAYIQNKPIVYDAEGIRDVVDDMWPADACDDGTNMCMFPEGSGGVSDYDDLTDKPILRVDKGTTRPAASADNKDILMWDENVQRLYVNILHSGHGATATWRDFTSTDLRTLSGDNDLNFRGTRDSYAALPNDAVHDDVYYLRHDDSFVWYSTNIWQPFPLSNHIQGFYTTEGACTRALADAVGSGTGTGYVCAYDTQNDLREQAYPRFSTAYTTPTSSTREWLDYEAALITEVGRALKPVGTPSDGQIAIWNDANSRWEVGDQTGGSGGGDRTQIGSQLIQNDDTVYQVALSPTVGANHQIEIEFGIGSDDGVIYAEVSSDTLLALDYQSTTPTNGDDAVLLKVGRLNDTALTTFGHSTLMIWKANDSSTDLSSIYVNSTHDVSPDATMTFYSRPLGGGGGAADGVANSVDLSLSGQDLTLTVTRSESLADLTDTVTLPDGSVGEANVQADWAETDTADDSYIQNKPEIISTAPGTGDGGKLPTVSAADLRYVNVSGDTVSGTLRVGGIVGTAGGQTITQFGTAATHTVGTSSGQIPELESAGNLHPRRLANNTPDALATDVQFLSNNTATTARWRDLDGYVNDFAGALLAALSEFTYDDSNDTLTFTGGGGGSDDGVADSVDLSLSGQDLTITIGRSGTLADLTDTQTLPAAGTTFTFTANPGGSGLTDLTTATFGSTSYDIGDTTAVNAVSSDAGGIDFTQRNGGTVEISRADLRSSIGASTTATTGGIPVSTGSPQISTGWLGSGTANNTKVLRGDGAWEVPTEITQDIVGTWLASLDEFTYDDAGNDIEIDISGDLDDITTSDHYKGVYDSGTTYEFGNVVSHNDAFWVVNNATLANANEPEPPVETTGWLEISDESGYRGSFDADDSDTYTFHTGDTVTIPGEGFFFCTTGGDYAPINIPNLVGWTRFLHQNIVTSGNIVAAISGTPTDEAVIVYDTDPENRLEWRTVNDIRTLIGAEIYVESSDITYDDNNNRRRITFDIDHLSGSSEGQTILFQYGDSDFTPATALIEVRVGTETPIRVRWLGASGSLEFVTLGDLTQDSIYELYRTDTVWHMIARTVEEIPAVGTHIESVSVDGADDGLDFTQVNNGTVNITRAELYEALGASTTAQASRIPQLDSGGQLNAAMIPNLAASQITSGTLDAARLPATALTQTTADARYLQLNPSGTTTRQTVQDPVTIDVSGNQEALVVDGSEAGSSAIFKITTNSSGSQKAFQANRTGQNLAFMEFGGATGGSGKAGIAIGSGTGGRDTNIYRDAANELRTDDDFEVGGDLTVDGDMNIAASDVPSLAASKITSGTFSTGRIPDLSASKITSGTLGADRIPDLSADKITSGTLDADRLPDDIGLAFKPSTEATWTRTSDFADDVIYHTNITPSSDCTIMFIQPIHDSGDTAGALASAGTIFYSAWNALGDAAPDGGNYIAGDVSPGDYIAFFIPTGSSVSGVNQFVVGKTSGGQLAVGITSDREPDDRGVRFTCL